jgi:hypothetical protein
VTQEHVHLDKVPGSLEVLECSHEKLESILHVRDFQISLAITNYLGANISGRHVLFTVVWKLSISALDSIITVLTSHVASGNISRNGNCYLGH